MTISGSSGPVPYYDHADDDTDCFIVEELCEPAPAPRLRKPRSAARMRPPTDHALDEEENMEHDNHEDDDFMPGLDPILDNVERWPNVLIMDSLLESAGEFTDGTPPPDAIIRVLDSLEKLAQARTLGDDETGNHSKYFHDAADWNYTPSESVETMEQQGDARRFMDGADPVIADATMSWNDGDAIFMIGHLLHKGNLLAYFGPKP